MPRPTGLRRLQPQLKILTLTRVLIALSFTVSVVSAAEKIDLTRTVPVPADQPIPIQDFTRRLLVMYPSLNPSGTHLGAVITNTEEWGNVAVVDLQTNKLERSEAKGPQTTISGVIWLNDKRVLTFENQVFAQEVGRMAAKRFLFRTRTTVSEGPARKPNRTVYPDRGLLGKEPDGQTGFLNCTIVRAAGPNNVSAPPNSSARS